MRLGYKKFDDFVDYTYWELEANKQCKNLQCRYVGFQALEGLAKKVDICYEFEQSGIVYQVALVCKAWLSPLTNEAVRLFWTRIHDQPDVIGVVIATSGYQSGAVEFARRMGIVLLSPNDLPFINQMIAERIHQSFLPNEYALGEPFWTLMEVQDGELTGSYCDMNGRGIPLLVSSRMAEDVLYNLQDKERWCVRGVSKRHLFMILELAETNHQKLIYAPIPLEGNKISFVEVAADTIRKFFI